MEQKLYEYLEKMVLNCHYPITLAGERPNVLNRWMIKSRWVEGGGEPTTSDASDTGPFLDMKGRLLNEQELGVLSNEELETNWRYYFADVPIFLGNQRTLYEYVHFYRWFNAEADKHIYGFCNIFCKQDAEVHFFIYAVSPIRLWVNGELVFGSSFHYFARPYRFIFKLRAGNNSVLVEQSVFMNDRPRQWNPGEFTIRIHPCSFLENSTNQWIDQQVIDDLKSQIAIIPDRAIYPAESAMKLVILPGYHPGTQTEPVKVTLSNAVKSVFIELTAETGREFMVDIDPAFTGLLWIQAETMTGIPRKTDIYVFRGDLMAARNSLIQRARERSFDEAIIENFIRTNEICDMQSGFFRNSWELILSEYYYVVFQKYWEFETRVNCETGPAPSGIFDVYKDNSFVFLESPIDQWNFTYHLTLPANYTAAQKYPLVFLLYFGVGLSQYPDLVLERYPERQRFTEAIIVCASARGGLNRDFLNQSNFYTMIARIQEEFSVDRERISLVGCCTGGMASAGLAMKVPHLFAAFSITWSTPRLDLVNPDFEPLRNMDSIMNYHLLNIDDYTFNFARLWNTQQHFTKTRLWIYNNLSHIEIEVMLDYRRLILEVMENRAERYPRSIHFTMDDPVFNRSYWLQVKRIDDLKQKALIKAQITCGNRIELTAQNIGRFRIYINLEAMGLEPEVEIDINGYIHRLSVSPLGLLDVRLGGIKPEAEYFSLDSETFAREYDRAGIDEDLLGFKRLYTGKCFVMKPDTLPASNQSQWKLLLKLLQLPMKERTRNYKYDSYLESKIAQDGFPQSNFLMIIDSRNPSPFQAQVLAAAGLKPGPEGIDYDGHQYSGGYFALIKCPHPYHAGHFGLMVIYNQDSVVGELISFWNTFDYNNYFFSDAVIYHQGQYHSFREATD